MLGEYQKNACKATIPNAITYSKRSFLFKKYLIILKHLYNLIEVFTKKIEIKNI